MRDIVQHLSQIVESVEPQLLQLNDGESGSKPSPMEWSKKEILGHLLDSAANNHHRFVRALYQDANPFPAYDQNKWVKIQQYNEMPWHSIILFWVAYNRYLCHVIECIPDDARSYPCDIGNGERVPLYAVVEDYLVHLRHHLNDILNNS